MNNSKAFMLLTGALLLGCSACGNAADNKSVKLDPKNPEMLTVWHYYNGMQQQIFDELVQEFNAGVGKEQGIYIEAHSKGSVNDLSDAVYASANNEVGADNLPDIFASYSDTAFDLDQMGLLANISDYMTEEEISEYIDAYVKEGCLNEENGLKVFPVAKSTELFLLNETAWNRFAAETGADKAELSTWEGLVETAKMYYEWTDAQTPDIEGDGQAFYGRDAFANYMLVGSRQLGAEIFQVENGTVSLNLDKTVMRKLWDCYYVPYVNGWFGAYGRFRSDDIKTGQLIALTGSTSGALYFPSVVTGDDGTATPIECGAYTVPNFEGTDPYVVQQGAGMAVAKSTKEKEYASVVFLKWLTEADHNIRFSMESGYLPVKKEANNIEVLEKAMDEKSATDLLRKTVLVGAETMQTYSLYSSAPFAHSNDARKVAEYNMPDAAAAAAAERDEMIASGMSREEAVAELTGDAAFESWYESFAAAMKEVVEK